MLGLAFVLALVGVCWVAAEHKCPRNIPVELWFLPAAIGGVFVGALLPFAPVSSSYDATKAVWVSRCDPVSIALGAVVAVGFGLALLAACVQVQTDHSLALFAVATVLAGVLLGLPIPSPGRREP